MQVGLFILLLFWIPVKSPDTPILNHMVYESLEACEQNIQAMEKVFEVMQNPTAVMTCQRLNPVSK